MMFLRGWWTTYFWKAAGNLPAPVLEAGGKPSTWFPPEGLVELIQYAWNISNTCKKQNRSLVYILNIRAFPKNKKSERSTLEVAKSYLNSFIMSLWPMSLGLFMDYVWINWNISKRNIEESLDINKLISNSHFYKIENDINIYIYDIYGIYIYIYIYGCLRLSSPGREIAAAPGIGQGIGDLQSVANWYLNSFIWVHNLCQ